MTDQTADACAVRLFTRKELDIPAATDSRFIDFTIVSKQLNAVLATVLVDVLRYRRHHYRASAIHSSIAAKEFMISADEELRHAHQLVERIAQLGGKPEYFLDQLTQCSHAGYFSGYSLSGMVREDMAAAGALIDCYRTVVASLGKHDPITRRMLESFIAIEEDHVDEFSEFLVSRFRPSAWMLETHRLMLPNSEVVLQPGSSSEERMPDESHGTHC